MIDFSEIAKAPAIWELFRFYVHSANEVLDVAFQSNLLKEMFMKKLYFRSVFLLSEKTLFK